MKILVAAASDRANTVSLLTLCYHWQTLSISFLLEMTIAIYH